ncbi:MAG TPA: hypothetical protein VJA00_03140 [Candidatus Omnitrophota bacterium]|nr:hypothetical protein [Candidatus Omnitrophota bacterium]
MEHIIQPSAMAFLGLWFPLERVNQPDDKTFFGNGQYLFITRNLYEKLGGHEKVRGEYLEDYALVREAKRLRAKTQCLFGISIFGTRMYDSLNSLWQGWRRIYLHAFESNPLRIFIKFLSVLTFSVLPFACFLPLTQMAVNNPDTYGFSWGLALVVLGFILFTAWKTYDILKAKRIFALLHPFAAIWIAMFLLDAFWLAARKKKTIWR